MRGQDLIPKRMLFVFASCCILITSSHAFAKLGPPLSKKEIIVQSEFIAIVRIHQVDAVSIKGVFNTYSQSASAIVEREIKGELPEVVTVFGGEDFSCAQVIFSPGRYLVFLRTDNNLLRGAEWQSSVRPIVRDVVEWYPDDRSFKMEPASLGFVLKDIENVLGYSIAPRSAKPRSEDVTRTEPYRNSLLLFVIAILVFALTINTLFRNVIFAGIGIYAVRRISKIMKR